MSETNSTITFQAKRALVAGVALDDTIQFDVMLTEFTKRPLVDKTSIKTKDGSRSSSLFYIKYEHQVSLLPDGVVTLPNLTTTPLTEDYFDMFFESVANDETFSITMIDQADLAVDVQLSSDWTPERRSAADVARFAHSFTVEVV